MLEKRAGERSREANKNTVVLAWRKRGREKEEEEEGGNLRDGEGLVDHSSHLFNGLDLVAPLGAGPRNFDRGTLLERVRAHRRGGHLATEGNERNAVSLRILQRGDDVGQARARCRQNDACFACAFRIAFRSVATALLRLVFDEFDGRGVECIQDGQICPSRVPKDVRYATLWYIRRDREDEVGC
jgi:hypothetical protein